jgi:hypothetical protein
MTIFLFENNIVLMHVYKEVEKIISKNEVDTNRIYAKLARAVANAWIGEKGAWKSRMKHPLSILPNCKTYRIEEVCNTISNYHWT